MMGVDKKLTTSHNCEEDSLDLLLGPCDQSHDWKEKTNSGFRTGHSEEMMIDICLGSRTVVFRRSTAAVIEPTHLMSLQLSVQTMLLLNASDPRHVENI